MLAIQCLCLSSNRGHTLAYNNYAPIFFINDNLPCLEYHTFKMANFRIYKAEDDYMDVGYERVVGGFFLWLI